MNRQRRLEGRAIRRRRRLRKLVERVTGMRVHPWQERLLDEWFYGGRNV